MRRGAERWCHSPEVTQQVRGSSGAVAQTSPTTKVQDLSPRLSLESEDVRAQALESENLLFSIPQSLILSPTPSFVGLEMGKQRGLFCPFTQWWGALTLQGWSEHGIKN